MRRPADRRRPAGRRRGVRGFGLLEALVALVILASTGVALFGWINANLDTVRRLRDREAEDRLRTQLAAWIQTLDPAQRPQGEAELLPGLTVRWDSRAVLAPQPVPPLPGGRSTPFQIGLYEVTASAAGPAGAVSVSARRVGTRRLEDATVPEVPRAAR